MPPLDAPTPLDQPVQNTQRIAEKLSQAVVADATAVNPAWKPLAPQNDQVVQSVLNIGLRNSPFTFKKNGAPEQGPNIQQSGGGNDASAIHTPSKAEEAMKLADSLEYAKDNFSKIDTDKDGQLSLGEVQSAMIKAEKTADAGKLGALFSNFDKVRRSDEHPLSEFLGSQSAGIEEEDIDEARKDVVSENYNVREADAGKKAMRRHDLYMASHADKSPMDELHEASAWLQGNFTKYDRTKDGVLHQLEILGALTRETDPGALKMLNVLSKNYQQLKHDKNFFEFGKDDGISLRDARQKMFEIEQKRDVDKFGKAMLEHDSQLFNALDSARTGKLDGKVTPNDLQSFLDAAEEQAKKGKPSDGVHTLKNLDTVGAMLRQWHIPFSAMTKLTGNEPGTFHNNPSFKLQTVKDVVKQ